jgi:NADH-quinone oxidoreductase subunit M
VTIHLSIILFWPMALALVAALTPRRIAPILTVLGALVPLGYAVVLLLDFDANADGLQYVTDASWIEELGIRYTLGVDGLSLWLIALTTLLFAFSAVWLAVRPYPRPKLFAFHMGVAETAVLGAFMAQDLALFVLFFDLMLVPFAFLVFGWGGPERRGATIKFVVYTLVGSLVMLAGAVATATLASDAAGQPLSFGLDDLSQWAPALSESTQRWLFAGFALAFLIKMPAFPFQGWMPDAYRQMPLPVLAVFSGVLSKVAAYGFLRIAAPLVPQGMADFQTVILLFGLVSIIYGSAMAFSQTDVRLILGYSSVAQLGFITLGIFALRDEGAQGAILQSVNHGLVVAPLFFIVLLLSERAGGSEDIKDMGGIAFRGPVLATLFLIVSLATLAIPGSANFVGEFLILLGLFKSQMAIAIIAFTGVALASVYMLRAFIRSMHNRKGPEVTSHEISFRDSLVLVPLVLCVLAFALYPQAALRDGDQAVPGSIAAAQEIDEPTQEEAVAVPAADPAAPVPVAPGEVPVAPGEVPVAPGEPPAPPGEVPVAPPEEEVAP